MRGHASTATVRRVDGSPSQDSLLDALRLIPDPELGVNIVDLGLIYDVDVDDQRIAHVTYTLTTPGCGIGPLLEGQMLEVLLSVPGVDDVVARLVFDPPWTRARIAPSVRDQIPVGPFQPPTSERPVQLGRRPIPIQEDT